MTDTALLSEAQILEFLAEINRHPGPHWEWRDGCLHKRFVFEDFAAAFAFMTRVATEAERMNHHPDWCNSYRTVTVQLTTHEAGGVTRLDCELAARTSALME